MNVAILGSGGREHALSKKISESRKIERIYCIPGNAGTSKFATNINIELNNFQKLLKFFKNNFIDLVVIGPEKPLVDGLADFLKLNRIKVLDQIKKLRVLRDLKFLLKIYVKNIKYLQQNLGFSKTKNNHFNLLKM